MAAEVTRGGYRRERVRQGPVPLSTKIWQGFGSLPGSHKDFAFNTFLLLFYSQILGLSASWTSAVLAIALIFDAVSDPLVGAYSDNFHSRFGRRHLFMYCAALPMGLFMYLLFTPPSNASQTTLLVWLFACVLCIRLSFTFFVVPWNALVADLSTDYAERTSIITFRYLVGWVGGVIFFFGSYSYIFTTSAEYPSGQLNPDHYSRFALLVSVLITLWVLVTTYFTHKEIPYLTQPIAPTPRFSLTDLLSQILLAFENRNFRYIFLATLCFAGLAGVGGVFDSYMNAFYWEFAGEQLRWFSFTVLAAILAFATIPMLQNRYQKQNILTVALTLVIIMGILKVTFRFADIWPDNGDPNLLIALIIHVAIVVYLLTTAGIMFASMMSDLVDEQEFHTGLRQEGVFSSAIGFSGKATTSLGIFIGGLLLELVVQFPVGAKPQEVAADTLFRLAFTDGILVHVFFVVPIYLLSKYSLTRERLEDMQQQVLARKSPTD